MRPVRISAQSGRVEVVVSDRSDVAVEGGRIADEPDGVVVTATAGHVRVLAPAHTPLSIGVTSGRVSVTGPAGRVSVATTSGRVVIAEAEAADVRGESARVEIETCAGECRVSTRSGRISLGAAGSASLMSQSGRIEADVVHGRLEARTASGRIRAGVMGGDEVVLETLSGRIDVAVPRDAHPSVDHRGADAAIELGVEMGTDFPITVRSCGGRVRVSYDR